MGEAIVLQDLPKLEVLELPALTHLPKLRGMGLPGLPANLGRSLSDQLAPHGPCKIMLD